MALPACSNLGTCTQPWNIWNSCLQFPISEEKCAIIYHANSVSGSTFQGPWDMRLGNNESRVTIFIFWQGGRRLTSSGGVYWEVSPSLWIFCMIFQGCLDAKCCNICCFLPEFLELEVRAPSESKDWGGGGSTLGHVYDRTYTIYSGVGRSFALWANCSAVVLAWGKGLRGGVPPPLWENFEYLSTLRCNLVLNLTSFEGNFCSFSGVYRQYRYI